MSNVKRDEMKVIHKITYPEGKIYVGKDLPTPRTIMVVPIAS